ncbi:hypothetical protein EVJ58_g8589 [Rhodofomes roseus]|uniref:Uncharacterized protein n=1 Tax=Rhodofomes roseus TaxID=34475 RepID=A0A4Y9XZI8_9APHY|nr:hypothetical protein EVJ58_g8589 [Rhodofomes roseus]
MALSLGSGGGYEVLSMILHVFADLLVFMRTIWVFRVKDQGSRGCLIMDGFIWSLSFMGCILLTIRAAAAGDSGLIQDYSALADARSAAIAVLTLSWLAFSLASMGITLDLFQPHRPADVTPFTPYTNPPERHRVVFHKNHRPLKIIEFQRETDPYYWKHQSSTKQQPAKHQPAKHQPARHQPANVQHPRAPKPAYARPTQKQPVRMDVAWSMA